MEPYSGQVVKFRDHPERSRRRKEEISRRTKQTCLKEIRKDKTNLMSAKKKQVRWQRTGNFGASSHKTGCRHDLLKETVFEEVQQSALSFKWMSIRRLWWWGFQDRSKVLCEHCFRVFCDRYTGKRRRNKWKKTRAESEAAASNALGSNFSMSAPQQLFCRKRSRQFLTEDFTFRKLSLPGRWNTSVCHFKKGTKTRNCWVFFENVFPWQTCARFPFACVKPLCRISPVIQKKIQNKNTRQLVDKLTSLPLSLCDRAFE